MLQSNFRLSNFTQVFPGNLLQPNYADPENPDRLLGRNEAERRGNYLDRLENLLPGGNRHPLLQLMKDCLHNAPSQRPTAEQLVTALEEINASDEGTYGELATIEAVRQVKMTKALKVNSNLLAAKDEEIRQLHQQLEVMLKLNRKLCNDIDYVMIIIDLCTFILQTAEERHEEELHQREEQRNVITVIFL